MEAHKAPPHLKAVVNGVECWTKTCRNPACRMEVLGFIHEWKDGRIVRTFCCWCPNEKETIQ